MTRRLLWLLAFCLLLALPAHAEESLSLPQCQTVEQVVALLRYPADGAQPVDAERGFIRYISQDTTKEPDFCMAYWLGGEPGGDLDLTLEVGRFKKPYDYYARNMCTRAVYSMALSYLGIDMTPGGMSAMLEKRDISAPYDEVTDLLPELEQVTFSTYVFQSMFEAYQSDAGYSPVYLYIRRPDNSTHALLVVARHENGRYIVIDPKYHEVKGEPVHVYTIALDKTCRKIVNSDFRAEQAGSKILQYHQWRLIETE